MVCKININQSFIKYQPALCDYGNDSENTNWTYSDIGACTYVRKLRYWCMYLCSKTQILVYVLMFENSDIGVCTYVRKLRYWCMYLCSKTQILVYVLMFENSDIGACTYVRKLSAVHFYARRYSTLDKAKHL